MVNFAPPNISVRMHTHSQIHTHLFFFFMVRINKINIIATLISLLLLSPNASPELLFKTPFQKPDYWLVVVNGPFISYFESK